jgi:hypothetical protein
MKILSLQRNKRLLIFSVLAIGVFIFILKEKSFAPSLVAHKNTCIQTAHEFISVDTPKPYTGVTNDFLIQGKARGMWYFEASFPILVLNEKGETIATTIGEATESWMTENFVPFKAHIVIPETYKGNVCLVLKKDNPSGLQKNDASITIPVVLH